MLKRGLSNSLVGMKVRQEQEHSPSGCRPWLKNVCAQALYRLKKNLKNKAWVATLLIDITGDCNVRAHAPLEEEKRVIQSRRES